MQHGAAGQHAASPTAPELPQHPQAALALVCCLPAELTAPGFVCCPVVFTCTHVSHHVLTDGFLMMRAALKGSVWRKKKMEKRRGQFLCCSEMTYGFAPGVKTT